MENRLENRFSEIKEYLSASDPEEKNLSSASWNVSINISRGLVKRCREVLYFCIGRRRYLGDDSIAGACRNTILLGGSGCP